MANNLSPEEVLKSYQAAFPNQTGDLFYFLWKQTVNLQRDWINYRSLFGTSPERIDLLNRTAPSFFARQERILQHDILIRIIKFADKRKDVASLKKLLDDVRDSVGIELQTELEGDYAGFIRDTKKIKTLRDNIITHANYSASLNLIEPLPNVSRADIEQAFRDIKTIMNKIEKHFKNAITTFEFPVTRDEAEMLIWALDKAQKYIQYEREEKQRKYRIKPNTKNNEIKK